MGPVVAIDLGGTKALAGVVEADGTVRSRVWLPSRDLSDRPAALLDRLADAAKAAAADAQRPFETISSIGLCVPGPMDGSRSVVCRAPNLGWVNVPVRAELERRLPGKSVLLENDVRAAALGEHRLGAGRGYRSMLTVFVGSGVGGGVVVDGALYHGAHGGAGEIGHMVLVTGGPRCGCGRAGCLEAMAARTAVARYVSEDVARGHRTILSEILRGDLLALTSRDLAVAVANSDAVAIRAARRSARYTGLAIGNVVNLIDPDLVVIGGGIAEALGQTYVNWAGEIAQRQILSNARDVPIVLSQLGDDAGLLGAALTAFDDTRDLC
ncbi:MAG: ROK family protein [Chloroflexi bacterium]|nr:ROK family protein [Chloroflexota bacterium]MBV9599414.1 ROK family protein [Chloroflexota bacterium]